MNTTIESEDPVLRLLNELLHRDEARKEELQEIRTLLTKAEKEGGETKMFRERTKKDIDEIKGALVRQDGQFVGLDQRISGNYLGQTAQNEAVLGELKEAVERLGNMERAVVENHRYQKEMQGALIDETNRSGSRATQYEGVITSLSEVANETKRGLGALAERVEKLEGLKTAATG